MSALPPDKLREFAAVMESEGLSMPPNLLAEEPGKFWNMFGHFARELYDRDILTDAELAQVKERFIAFTINRARMRTN